MQLTKRVYENCNENLSIISCKFTDKLQILIDCRVIVNTDTGESELYFGYIDDNQWVLISDTTEVDKEIHDIPFEIAKETQYYKFIGEPFDEFIKSIEDNNRNPSADVPYMLEFGNVDLEMTIDADTGKPYYYICIRTKDTWLSYEPASEPVNLNTYDIERAMYNTLMRQVSQNDLNIFNYN